MIFVEQNVTLEEQQATRTGKIHQPNDLPRQLPTDKQCILSFLANSAHEQTENNFNEMNK